MKGESDGELMEVLRQLPPLMPLFLQRRRVGLPVVGELMTEMGLERPLLFMLVHIVNTEGIQGKEEVTLAEMRAYDPYAAVDYYSDRLEKLEERGLVIGVADGSYRLSGQARTAVDRLHTEGTAYVAGRMVLPRDETERLAGELRRAADAVAANPVLAPRSGRHLRGYRALSRYGDQAQPMVQIEQAVGELWGARDDAYMMAWREADMEGPPLDVMSHVWSGFNTVGALNESLRAKQTAEDIENSLVWLVEREYVERDGDEVRMTPQGVMVREDIENETDRVYFDGWPFTIEEAKWMRDKLGEMVAQLGQ
jgi:hypothetical protein